VIAHGDPNDLPAPLPWLEEKGPVTPLDRKPSASTEPVKMTAATAAAPAKAAPAKPAAPSWLSRFKFFKPQKRPGSGIPARPIIRRLVWARRFAQVFFLLLFLYFLAQTALRGTFSASSDTPVRLP